MLNIAVWIASGLLAAVYISAGVIKTARPKPQLMESLPWTEDASPASIKAIGALEALGAIGLILPWLTGIAPVLTPLAAIGLVIVQAGAIVVHLRRDEAKVTPFNIALLLIALFIAIGRFVQLAG
ncbi:MAG: DoxX family protein [Arachnia sp.]